MKKRSLIYVFLIIISMFLYGCKADNTLTDTKKNEIKKTIDLVLSYKNGYDDTMKKYITENNFHIANYVYVYSSYIGQVDLQKYESSIKSIKEEDGKYKVCMILNLSGVSLEEPHNEDNSHDGHDHDDEKTEITGEDVPVEVVVKKIDNNYFIQGFTEYESLEKAAMLNKGFK